MWGFLSKDPAKDFPYELGEAVGQVALENKSVWRLHAGKHRTSGEVASIFVCDTKSGASNTQLDVARSAVKRLKTLRHPSVLTFLAECDSPTSVLLATEPVSPLSEHLGEILDRGPKREYYLAWGIFQVCRALAFLNNDAKLKHNNINSASVFVTRAGDWKLAGLEYVCATDAQPQAKILPCLEKYDPPERKDQTKARLASPWAADIWGLGCLIWEVYNGCLTTMDQLGRLGDIPTTLQPAYKECVGANPGKRPSPQDVITKLRRSPGFFKNDLIDIVLFLEELQIKEEGDKSRFFTSLPGLLDNCPANVCQGKILPQLINAFEFGGAGSAILAPVFKIGKELDTQEFQTKIVPCIVKLFSSNDRNARFKLLSQMENFVEHLSNKIVNDQVFPKIESGFLDTEPLIREKTVISMIHLASKLSYSNLDELVVLKHFVRLARDEQGGIRTNTIVCLGKIARHLHPKTRQQALLACFARGLKDPFPPSRIASINAIAATQQFYTVQETGSRVLPVLAPATVDPEKPVREQALRVIRGFLGKLEKVSEDPSLAEEMDKEVGSTNSAATAAAVAAAGWASWAVGAVTAKFYKSPAGAVPGSAGGSQEGTPVPQANSLKPSGERSQDISKGSMSDPSKEATVAIASVSLSDASGGDGWGDEDDGGGGWDDADGGDWGSLEEPMQPQKLDNDDWVGSFNSGVKSHSAASPMSFNSGVKSHSTLSPVTTEINSSDSWGNDWGDSNSSTMNSSDEARKRREEKKAERQKEIEAKRAAKKGPMRLGAKKNLD